MDPSTSEPLPLLDSLRWDLDLKVVVRKKADFINMLTRKFGQEMFERILRSEKPLMLHGHDSRGTMYLCIFM